MTGTPWAPVCCGMCYSPATGRSVWYMVWYGKVLRRFFSSRRRRQRQRHRQLNITCGPVGWKSVPWSLSMPPC